jgi:hypothetical protein
MARSDTPGALARQAQVLTSSRELRTLAEAADVTPGTDEAQTGAVSRVLAQRPGVSRGQRAEVSSEPRRASWGLRRPTASRLAFAEPASFSSGSTRT